MLEVQNVERRFGGLIAVNDVSMKVAEGEIVALIGPNGAGKTPVFNVIAGALPPCTGTVCYQGRSIRSVGSARISHLGPASIVQLPRLFTSMTALETASSG